MKLGVKEFRERFSELAEGQEPVLVTKNGRVVGTYHPARTRTHEERVRDWADTERRLEKFRTEWRANTPDWKERLVALGIFGEGEAIDECD